MESMYEDIGVQIGPTNRPPPGLINALILGCMYGYFALNFDGDSDVCYANDENDKRLADDAKMTTESHYTNVGQIFHFCF